MKQSGGDDGGGGWVCSYEDSGLPQGSCRGYLPSLKHLFCCTENKFIQLPINVKHIFAIALTRDLTLGTPKESYSG